MGNIITWFSEPGHYASIVALIWTIDQLLKIIAPLTSFKWDDNLADMFGKLIARFLPPKQ
jgi:hypothetical protein